MKPSSSTSSKERQFNTGDVIYMEAQDHIGQNVGTTPTEAVIVELKEPGTAATLMKEGWNPSASPGSRDAGR